MEEIFRGAFRSWVNLPRNGPIVCLARWMTGQIDGWNGRLDGVDEK